MAPEEEIKENTKEYRKAVGRLKSKRNFLQEEILRELNKLLRSQNLDVLQIKVEIDKAIEILKKNDLTGEEADIVSGLLGSLSLLEIGDREMISNFLYWWDILYPIKVKTVVDNQFAIRYLLKVGD